MNYSMTGFAALEKPIVNATLLLELRAVNSRYLDLHFKLDENLRGFEPTIRELISAQLNRGKIECKVNLIQRTQLSQEAALDGFAVYPYAHALARDLHTLPGLLAAAIVSQHLIEPDAIFAADIAQQQLRQLFLTRAVQHGQQGKPMCRFAAACLGPLALRVNR